MLSIDLLSNLMVDDLMLSFCNLKSLLMHGSDVEVKFVTGVDCFVDCGSSLSESRMLLLGDMRLLRN